MNDYVIQVFMLAKNDEILLSTGEYELKQFDFQYDEKANNNYPQKLELNLNSNQGQVSLNVESIIDSDYMLSEFNPILRILAKNLLKLNPGYFRFNSNFDVSVNIGENKIIETGKTLHEMVILKQPKNVN